MLQTTKILSHHQRFLVSDIHKEKCTSINKFLGRLHEYDIIILQDNLLDHPPVVTYFTRHDYSLIPMESY